MSFLRRTRQPATLELSKFRSNRCSICNARYYLHVAIAGDLDTGRCLNCDIDIAELDRIFCLTPYLVGEIR